MTILLRHPYGFMKTDKLFILMLVILLPLTGCIDVSDNANADESVNDEGGDETTVINNFYNNTTVMNAASMPEYRFLIFDTELENGEWPQTTTLAGNTEHVLLGSFNTTGGLLNSIVYTAHTCETTDGWNAYAECYVAIKSACGDVVFANQLFSAAASETMTIMLKGTVAGNCTHEVYSYYNIEQMSQNVPIRMHFEIAMKEIVASSF
jgi:hypothetical protein